VGTVPRPEAIEAILKQVTRSHAPRDEHEAREVYADAVRKV